MKKINVAITGGIGCGKSTVIEYIESLHFDDEDLKYLSSLGIFGNDFIEAGKMERFQGSY